MNQVVWFEIPVQDLKRAMKFYSKVVGEELQQAEFGAYQMAFFPYAPGTVSGALVENKEHIPTTGGTLIYLNGGDDLSAPLKRVMEAGGKVVQEKTSIGPYGYMAIFKDSEGNQVALHSMN